LSNYLEYRYVEDGPNIPDIPIVQILLSVKGRKQGIQGPALVDTGFDRGLYANLIIAKHLKGERPAAEEALEAPGHIINCEIFKMECRLTDQERSIDLGEVSVHVPTNPEDLTEEALIGRTLINQLEITLNGRTLRARMPKTYAT